MPDGPTHGIERLLKDLIRRERLANTVAADMAESLDDLVERIVEALIRGDPTAVVRSRYRRERVERVLKEIQGIIREHNPEMTMRLKGHLAEIGRAEAKRAELALKATLGQVGAKAVRNTPITQARLRAILNTDPFRGKILAEHTQRLSANVYDRALREIRMGMTEEESIPDIVRRIRGPVLNTTTRNAEALARTAVNHVSNVGMMETFKENADIVGLVRYVATLDSRTCFAAGTGVLTPKGYRPIEDIRPGDTVVGGSRSHRRVLGARSVTKTDMARVHLSNGAAVDCTADHPWLTAGGVWTQAGDLRAGELLASDANMPYIRWHENVSCVREESKGRGRQSEQVLRPPVLSGRAEAGRLRGVPGHQQERGSVRYLREASYPDGIEEARWLAGGSPLLLTGLLPRAPQAQGGMDVRGVRVDKDGGSVARREPEVLLPRMPGRPQARRARGVLAMWRALYANLRARGWGGGSLRPHDMFGRVREGDVPHGRGEEAEDRGGVPGGKASELEGRKVVPVQRRVQGAGVGQGGRPGAKEGRVPLRDMRQVSSGEREGPGRSPRGPVPQFRERGEGQPCGELGSVVQVVPRHRRSPSRRRSDNAAVGEELFGATDLRLRTGKRSPQGQIDRGRRVSGASPPLVRRDGPKVGRRVRREPQRNVLRHQRSYVGARPVSVRRVERFSRPTTVYDIHVDLDRSFVVAGCVVHNSEICASLDGQSWPLESDDIKQPPQHFQCRSILVPEVDWEALGVEPPPDGTRAARDADGKAIQVPSSTTYEQWLKGQPADVQDRVLGKGKADLFRKGEITLSDIVRRDNTVVPLSQLGATGGGAFVPASTVAEAEEWARRNAVEGAVSYQGMGLDQANEVNEALHEMVVQNGYRKVGKVRTEFGRVDAWAYQQADSITISRKMSAAERAAMAAKHREKYDGLVARRAAKMEELQDALAAATGAEAKRLRKEIRRYEQYPQAARWTVDMDSDKPWRDTIVHEFGHLVHDRSGSGKSYEASVLSGIKNQSFQSILDRRMGARGRRIATRISEYAASSLAEHFAEAWVAYHRGMLDLIDDDVIALIEELIEFERTGRGP